MNVFIVIIEDRHTDVDAEVFRLKEDAVRYAKMVAGTYNYVDLEEHKLPENCHFFARLSNEGCCLCVQEVLLR